MFRIGVYETRKNRIQIFREMLVRYSMQTDRDIDVFWLVGTEMEEKLEQYVYRMQLIFISMESPGNKKLGDRIYRLNPECRICYYKTEKSDLAPLLSARPIAFHLWKERTVTEIRAEHTDVSNVEFVQQLDGLLNEILEAGGTFIYETRKTKQMIPVKDILYFQSNLKYVEVHTKSGANYSIYAKLSEIDKILAEENISDAFLRIHKSYIVNLADIKLLDKANHTIHLADGEIIPVSDAHYGNVLKRMSWK